MRCSRRTGWLRTRDTARRGTLRPCASSGRRRCTGSRLRRYGRIRCRKRRSPSWRKTLKRKSRWRIWPVEAGWKAEKCSCRNVSIAILYVQKAISHEKAESCQKFEKPARRAFGGGEDGEVAGQGRAGRADADGRGCGTEAAELCAVGGILPSAEE